MKTYAQLKIEAKRLISGHFKEIFMIYLPLFVVFILSGIAGTKQNYQVYFDNNFQQWETFEHYSNIYDGFGIILPIATLIISLMILPNIRKLFKTGEYDTNVFKNLNSHIALVGVFISLLTVLISIAVSMLAVIAFMFLLFAGITSIFAASTPISALLIIAAFVAFVGLIFYVSLATSIIPYIVNEYNHNNQAPIGWHELSPWNKSVTATKDAFRLMKGYRMDLFWFNFSYIGWYFLVGITLGFAAFYVIPYQELGLYNWFQDRIMPEESQNRIDVTDSVSTTHHLS